LINSREYQDRREDLYLAALPVTLERFAFAAQLLAMEVITREASGTLSSDMQHNRWTYSSTVGFSKLFATGALLLFQFANQTVMEFVGKDRGTTSVSTINLDVVQPLLRGGGKAVTLEPLTQVERNLLYEVRDYARFRKLYFQFVSGGSDLTANLLAPGATLGGAALTPGTTVLASGNGARPLLLP